MWKDFEGFKKPSVKFEQYFKKSLIILIAIWVTLDYHFKFLII